MCSSAGVTNNLLRVSSRTSCSPAGNGPIDIYLRVRADDRPKNRTFDFLTAAVYLKIEIMYAKVFLHNLKIPAAHSSRIVHKRNFVFQRHSH